MQIVYLGHLGEVWVPYEVDGRSEELWATRGEPVEAPNELASLLMEQSTWVLAPSS
jgi:hypothetical protein